MKANNQDVIIKSVEVLEEEDKLKQVQGIAAGKTVTLSKVKITLDVDNTLAGYIDSE